MLEQIIFLKQLEAKLEILEARQLEQWHSIKVMRDELAKEMTRITNSIELMSEEEAIEEELINNEIDKAPENRASIEPEMLQVVTMEEQIPASVEVIPAVENHIPEAVAPEPVLLAKEEVIAPAVAPTNIAPVEPPVAVVKETVVATPSNNNPSQSSINDQYNNKPNNLAEQLTLKPINDLKSAIGTNDRFLFIAQLFGGDANKFNQAIVNLNHCANLDAAIQHLHNNYKRSEWEQNHKTLEQLEIYLRRRYANS